MTPSQVGTGDSLSRLRLRIIKVSGGATVMMAQMLILTVVLTVVH